MGVPGWGGERRPPPQEAGKAVIRAICAAETDSWPSLGEAGFVVNQTPPGSCYYAGLQISYRDTEKGHSDKKAGRDNGTPGGLSPPPFPPPRLIIFKE